MAVAAFDQNYIILATNPCAAVQCLKGSRCEVFEPTGEPFCTPSCDLDNGGCPDGQICTIQDVQCVRAPCPSAIKCCELTAVLADHNLYSVYHS